MLFLIFENFQVRSLSTLRDQLNTALTSTSDERFEEIAACCRDAAIHESRAVRTRLRSIELPRQLLAQLAVITHTPLLDSAQIQRVLSSAADALASDSPNQALALAVADATTLVSSLRTLDSSVAHGRRAHAQMLVSPEHDVAYIGALEFELKAFVTVAAAHERASPSPRPTSDASADASFPGSANAAAVHELLVRWRAEEGPASVLKTAVRGFDCDAIRRAIVAAQEAGLGTKAAKKRLTRLEQTTAASVDLAAALESNNATQLRAIIAHCRTLDMDVDHAREVLRVWSARDSAKTALDAACATGRAEPLLAAIAAAEEFGLDTALAQEKLEAVYEHQRALARAREEELALRRASMSSELGDLVRNGSTHSTSTGSPAHCQLLAEKIRSALDLGGVDVTSAMAALGFRLPLQTSPYMARRCMCAGCRA